MEAPGNGLLERVNQAFFNIEIGEEWVGSLCSDVLAFVLNVNDSPGSVSALLSFGLYSLWY